MFNKIFKFFKKDKPLIKKSSPGIWNVVDELEEEDPKEIDTYEKILDNLTKEEMSKIENVCKDKVKITCIKNFKKKTSNFSNDFKGYMDNRRNPSYNFTEGQTYEVDRSEKDVIYVSQHSNVTINTNPRSNDKFSLVNGKPNYKYFFEYFMLESEYIAIE